jgi:uncharacterized membrane protein
MRAAAKTSTYATMHFVIAAIVAYAITGDWRAALAISLIEPAVQTVAYVFHERAWARFWPPRATATSAPNAPPLSDSEIAALKR